MREDSEQVIEQEVGQTSSSQEAPQSQATRLEKKRSLIKSRWMRYFFTEDISPDNYPLIDLQRRATWVGVALILQALNEIDRRYYMLFVPFLKPWAGFIPFILILGSFIAMWMAFRTTARKQQAGRPQGSSPHQARPRRWQRIILIGVLLTSIAGGIQLGRSIALSFFMPPQYSNDGTSLDINAAALLVQGRNPYTDSDIVHLVRQFLIEPYWTTPLRAGQFANRIEYPSTSELRSVLDTDLKAGHAPEFESKVSYPALSFLTLVPFVWLNIFNVLSFYLFCYIALVFIAWKVARPELRPWILLLSVANVSMLGSVVGGNLDIFYALLIVLVWLLRDRGWWSAIFLGLALASKQLAWFFIPFYAIMVWRQYNFMEVVRRLTIAAVIALAINLPFILWNPHAWLAGVMAPISDPMFPMGAGLISLSSTPLLPVFPQAVYDVLEVGAMLAAFLWYWRLCKKRPEAAMLLAVIPLFFAWRSLSSYFYCSAFPLFLLMAAKAIPGKGKLPEQALKVRSPFDHDGAMISDIPSPVGARAAFHGIYYLRNWLAAKVTCRRPGFGFIGLFSSPMLPTEDAEDIGKGQESWRPQGSTG